MRHGIGQRLKRRCSQKEILGTRSSDDGITTHERKGAHAQGKHEHRQVESKTEFLPGEGLGIDVGGLCG